MPVRGVGQITLTDLNDVVASATKPLNATEGALWWNLTDSRLYVYSRGRWEVSANYEDYVRSRGENLVTNGNGLLGNNTNFKSFTFDGSQSFGGAGSFYTAVQNGVLFNDELIPVDPSRKYKISLMAMSKTGLGKDYFGSVAFDIDGNRLDPSHYYAYNKPVTTLAQDLKVGDTKIYLTSSTGFIDNNYANSAGHLHSIIFWGYKNSYGYEYPVNTYSRFAFNSGWLDNAIDRTTHVITLSKPFNIANPSDPQGVFRAGHKVSPTQSGGTYQYSVGVNVNVPTTWTKYEGVQTGNGINANQFPYGTAFIKLMVLSNRDTSGGVSGDALWLNSLSVSDVTDLAGLSDSVTAIEATLGNMANDNILDFTERKIIKDKISEIIGSVIADTVNMPEPATLTKGDYYSTRKSATNAGIPTTEPLYIAVESKYNSLKTYLNAQTPIKPWNTSTADKDKNIAVTKATFRTNFLDYYIAIDALATATSEKLKQNVDDINIGGRNYASNGDFTASLTNTLWSNFYFGQTKEIVDISSQTPMFKYALRVNNTSNGIGGISSAPMFAGDVANSLVNKDLTIQFWIKYQNIVQGTNSFNCGRFGELVIEGETSTGTKVYSYPKIMNDTVGTNMTWQKVAGTIRITMPSSAVKLTGISFKHGLDNCKGEFWTTGIKVELGNKVTDWSDNPLDMQGKIVDVEQKITPEGIMSTVSSSQTWILQQKSLENLRALTKVRYIRDTVSGYTVGVGTTVTNVNHWLEIQAFANDVNVASGKTVTGTGTVANLARVTDGIVTSSDATSATATGGSVTVDLGTVREDIDTIKVFHPYHEARIYRNTKTEVSADGISWITIFDSAVSGTYQETVEGRESVVNRDVAKNMAGVGGDISLLKTQLGNVEQAITPEGITTVISNSVFFENLNSELEGKADASAIGNLATKEELDRLNGNVDSKIGSAVAGINFAPYATKLDLEQTSKNITSKFSATGGMNLLKNSIGYADFGFWTKVQTGVTTPTRHKVVRNTGLDTLGFGSGFYFPSDNTNPAYIEQVIPVVIGQKYTLSWYANKTNLGAVGVADHEFYVQILSGSTVITQQKYNSERVTNGFEPMNFVFQPTTTTISVRILANKLADVTVTGLMLTIGDIPLQWSLATGETYNTNVRLDINGIRVSQLNSERVEIGYTEITPQEFAGYYDPNGDGNFEKIFYLNGDETVTKKIRALNEITMGSLKIIKVESGNNKGWAFVPILE